MPAKRALLFGSFARGTADTRSDIDLLIVDDEPLPYAGRLERYFKPLAFALSRPVEIIVYTSEELANADHRPFIRRALTEGVVVYERRETLA